MNRMLNHLRANVVAYLALFVALAGTSYAAVRLPANSVGERQIQNHVIGPVKFNPRVIGGYVHGWALVDADGKVLESRGRVKVQVVSFLGPGEYTATWSGSVEPPCTSVASIDARSASGSGTTAGFVDTGTRSSSTRGTTTLITTYNTSGISTPLPFDVALLC